tara:strand:+ start:129 stop:962 length:834 start_codon:yes stop_codon:yes gene_type:complete
MAKHLKKMQSVSSNLKDDWYCMVAKGRLPAGSKIQKDDEVLLAENGYGIFGRGFVNLIIIKKFNNLTDFIFHALHKSKIKDDAYWLSKIKEYGKLNNNNIKLNLIEFTLVNTEQFDTIFPLEKRFLNESSWYYLEDNFKLRKPNKNTILTADIPSFLREKIYHMYKIKASEHVLDIDHFVPQSLGGPGNIIENLVPISASINRRKSNRVPSKLFQVGKDNFNIDLPNNFKLGHNLFYNNPAELKIARDIISKINIIRSESEIRKIYSEIRKYHFPNL